MSFEWHAQTPLAFILFFLLLWSGISLGLARAGGWGRLAEPYRSEGDFEGTRWILRSARLGSVNYANCLTFGVNERGLYISVLFPFCLAHPPLFIPWHDVGAEERRGWFFEYLDFRFAQVPDIRIRVSERLGKSLISAAGRPLTSLRKVPA
jgi:hypothetical protein